MRRGEQTQVRRDAESGRIRRDQPQYGRGSGTTVESIPDSGRAREQYGNRGGARDQQSGNRGLARDDQRYGDRNRGQGDQRYGDRNTTRDDQRYGDRAIDRDRQYGNRGQTDNGRYGDSRRNQSRNNPRGDRNYGSYGQNGRYSMMREGRVQRISHERGGYRVWLGGFGFPFWVPEARWSRWPLRVGINIRIGGWWDPVGYYDAYDVGPIGGYYNTAGDIHGIVENVDRGRGTLVLRDDISRSFVTVVIQSSDWRLRDLRPGDYVDLSGQWTRGGVFRAFRLDALRDGRDDRYDDPDYDRYDDGYRR